MTKKTLPISLLIFIILAGLLTGAPPSSEWKLKVSVRNCPVFKSPSHDSSVLLSLPAGTQLVSYIKSGEWYRVVVGPDEQGYLVLGYVRSGDLEIQEQDEQEAPEIWPDKPHFFKEIGFAIRLFTSYNLINRGDIRDGTRGLLDNSNTEMVSMGLIPSPDFDNMKSILEMGGEVLYTLTPRLSVGLGASHLSGGKIDVIRYATQGGQPAGQIDTDLRFSAIPIRLIVKYSHPLSRLFNLTFTGVPTLYLAKLKYIQINPHFNTESIQIRTDSQSFGISGILGIEFNISPNAVFYLEGAGRAASIGPFKGEQILYGENIGSSFSNKTTGTLYYVQNGNYSGLTVSSEAPAGNDSTKTASFNFSGFSLRAGVTFRF